MASITANLGGGVNVVATQTPSGIKYTINLANGSSVGPYTGDELVDVGSGLRSFPLPVEFRLTYKNQTVATSTDPGDIEHGGDIVPNTYQIQQYAEKQLAVSPDTNAADAPNSTTAAKPPENVENASPAVIDENVPGSEIGPTDFSPITITSHSDPYLGDATNQPYDDEGNLNPGWQIDDATGQPFYVGDIPKVNSAPETISAGSDPSVAAAQGTPYDDTGNLNPGWSLDEEGNPVYVGGDFVEPSTLSQSPSTRGLSAPQVNTNSQATQQDAANFAQLSDWRVRLALAPSANYLYKNKGNEGILLPLAATDGVIFPYTPAISVQYAASYDATELTHSNYKFFQYKSSSVDNISITCDFTAQDTTEANYLLAVIHFFRSVTKMFYGQDQNPVNGTPPPLCYLYGLGSFQFDTHPIAITGFTYTLPTDVDYIRAGATTTNPGVSNAPSNVPNNSNDISQSRLGALQPGGGAAPPNFASNDGTRTPTYVPTKIQMSISAIPIVTRNDISNNFSLNGPNPNYGSGALLQGSKRKGGGIW